MSWRPILSRKVSELRFLFCQKSPQSAAVRSFVKTQYPALKEANPHLPILIRESADVKPMLIARYPMGVEVPVSLGGLSEADIESSLKEIASKE